MTRRGPVDPRLARLSAPARRWIAVAALLAALVAVAGPSAGVLGAAVVLVPACLLAALWHLRAVSRADREARGRHLMAAV